MIQNNSFLNCHILEKFGTTRRVSLNSLSDQLLARFAKRYENAAPVLRICLLGDETPGTQFV